MKSKEALIKEYLAKPAETGDVIKVLKNNRVTKVHDVSENGTVLVKAEHSFDFVELRKDEYVKTTRHIGYNPFSEKPWNSKVRFVQYDLANILASLGFDWRNLKWKKELVNDIEVYELNWNPTIVDSTGHKQLYQRDFCWSEEDGRKLIDSIYNNVNIGSIVVRKRSYRWVENHVRRNYNEASFKDIVDGKQRLNAIVQFLTDGFADSNGMYWSEFSDQAQRKFLNFNCVAFGEMGENSSDEDVKQVFLGINFSGVQMSETHIDYVRNIKL